MYQRKCQCALFMVRMDAGARRAVRRTVAVRGYTQCAFIAKSTGVPRESVRLHRSGARGHCRMSPRTVIHQTPMATRRARSATAGRSAAVGDTTGCPELRQHERRERDDRPRTLLLRTGDHMNAYGRYLLTLRCDEGKTSTRCAACETFEGPSPSVTRRMARDARWLLDDKAGRVLCPKCRVVYLTWKSI